MILISPWLGDSGAIDLMAPGQQLSPAGAGLKSGGGAVLGVLAGVGAVYRREG